MFFFFLSLSFFLQQPTKHHAKLKQSVVGDSMEKVAIDFAT